MSKSSTWKGAAGLAADVRYYGEWMRERAFERIGHLYPQHNGETVIAWLWARTVISPNPAVNAPVPLVRSFILSKKKGRECWAQPIIEGKTVRFEVQKGLPPKDQDGTMIRRQGACCIISGEPIPFDYIRTEGKAGRLGSQLIAIVTEGDRRRNYYSPNDEHIRIAKSAEPEWKPAGKLPKKALSFRVQIYGMDEYNKLFTSRQLVALTTFSDLIAEVREKATQDALRAGLPDANVELKNFLADSTGLEASAIGGRPISACAYGEAVSVYLALAVDRGADIWSSLCSWDLTREHISNVFARQAIPMVWDYAEGNPLSDSTGNWSSHINWICKVIERLPNRRAGFARQADAAQITTGAMTLSTDPPYYDNIGYADLSDFFYVWLRRNLRDIYPAVFSTMLVPKAAELIASKYRHGSKDEAKTFFESGMLDAFTNFRRFARQDYPLTVYYAFKQQDAGFLKASTKGEVASTGWETMLTSLINSSFSVVGTWPMRTEGKSRLNAMGTNALASSIILVCRPRPAAARATSLRRFRNELRDKLPAAIANMQSGSIAPVDLAQASIGPGMAIYSQYKQVLEADGRALTVREALALINEALDRSLAEQDASLDSETRFAIGWFAQFAYEPGAFGEADVLARARNTSVQSVALADVATAAGGQVRLIHWRDYYDDYDPAQDKRLTVWEGAHHLIKQLRTDGEEAAAVLYNQLPSAVVGEARSLAYRLYGICERQGWAEQALDYNALGSSWSEISRRAARDEKTQVELL